MSGVELISIRANPPVCWACDRLLCCGGWQYALVASDDGKHRHPVHKECAKREGREILAESVGRAPKAAKKAQGDWR